jgi:NTE family protein
MSERTPAPRVALVIGAGAIKCSAALGVYKVLQREGIEVDMVAATSGGTLTGSLIALGYDADTASEMTLRLWTRELTRRRNWKAIRQAALPRLFGFSERWGLVDDRLIVERLREAYGDRTFADTRIPLFVVATDFRNGQKVVLEEGLLVDAIRASIAIPFIFEPWPIGDRLFMDGAQSDPMPIDVAIRERADLILAIGFESPYQRRVGSIARFAFQVTTVMTNNLFQSNFAFQNLAHHNEVITVVPRFEERIGAFDTRKLPKIIEAGERAIEEHLPYLHQLITAAGG